MMRVVKIGGRAQGDPCLAPTLREAWDAEPGELCVVHGGGDEMSAMQRALGREAAFVGGRARRSPSMRIPPLPSGTSSSALGTVAK